MASGGGWSPGLVTTDQGVGREASVLASEHMMVKRIGVTLDASTITADGDGNKILAAGTFVGPIAANGKYTTVAGGGVADPDTSGYLTESFNLRDGDVVAGILIHGSLLAARVDTTPSAAVAGRIIFQ